LGAIATATFRLHPLPEMTRTAVFRNLSAADVVSRVAALRQAQLEPARVVAIRRVESGRFDLGVAFEGFEKGVAYQLVRLREIGSSTEDAFWPEHDRIRAGGPLRIKLALPASRLPVLDDALAPLWVALDRPSFAWYASLGVGFVSGDAGDPKAL